jgi:hypothetical protein
MKNMLTIRPGACLGGMAGQCPRGRLDATRGGLHRGTTGSTAPGASTGVHTHQDLFEEAPQVSERSQRGIELSGGREVKSQAGSSHGSPRRRAGRRNYLVEVEEGTEASISPKVAMAEVAGVGRNGQVMATANQIARGSEGRRRRASGGWAGSVDRPRPEPGRLSRGRVGRLGRLARWAKKALAKCLNQNFKFKSKCYFLFEFKPNSKMQITFIKHFLNL